MAVGFCRIGPITSTCSGLGHNTSSTLVPGFTRNYSDRFLRPDLANFCNRSRTKWDATVTLWRWRLCLQVRLSLPFGAAQPESWGEPDWPIHIGRVRSTRSGSSSARPRDIIAHEKFDRFCPAGTGHSQQYEKCSHSFS